MFRSWMTIFGVMCLATCSSRQEMAGTFGTPHLALYRQMDALRDFSCQSLHAGISNADSRVRSEELARRWLAIEQGVADEREKDRATRSDRPNLSMALSAYWTQWQHAVNTGQACFDNTALASADADGGFVRANGSGSWVVVRKAGDPAVPLSNDVLLKCSNPQDNPNRDFAKCAREMTTVEMARKH